jgi:carboxymethylenebutenolidase
MMDHINVKGQGGTFSAYIARPKTSPASAVVVLQELFGVNADIREHCNELAEQGYLAVAPDLYWRQEPGVKDIKDTIDAARNLPECNGKVALLGYCLGALMVFMTAVRNDGIDAAVWYHGADTEKYLGEVDGLHAPILMHLAEEDEFISKPAQAEIKAALTKKLNATVYSYPGQSHAFSRHNGKHYNAAAAHLANGRTSEFLDRHLR